MNQKLVLSSELFHLLHRVHASHFQSLSDVQHSVRAAIQNFQSNQKEDAQTQNFLSVTNGGANLC